MGSVPEIKIDWIDWIRSMKAVRKE